MHITDLNYREEGMSRKGKIKLNILTNLLLPVCIIFCFLKNIEVKIEITFGPESIQGKLTTTNLYSSCILFPFQSQPEPHRKFDEFEYVQWRDLLHAR